MNRKSNRKNKSRFANYKKVVVCNTIEETSKEGSEINSKSNIDKDSNGQYNSQDKGLKAEQTICSEMLNDDKISDKKQQTSLTRVNMVRSEVKIDIPRPQLDFNRRSVEITTEKQVMQSLESGSDKESVQ